MCHQKHRVEVYSGAWSPLRWSLGGRFQEHKEAFQAHHGKRDADVRGALAQVEACLNSRPLVTINSPDDDGVEVLTPGHFLIGQPLSALPDPSSYRTVSLLRRHLCQYLVRHFWQRWSMEYLSTLSKFNKWHCSSRNLSVGDVVVLREDGIVATRQSHPSAPWRGWSGSRCDGEDGQRNL